MNRDTRLRLAIAGSLVGLGLLCAAIVFQSRNAIETASASPPVTSKFVLSETKSVGQRDLNLPSDCIATLTQTNTSVRIRRSELEKLSNAPIGELNLWFARQPALENKRIAAIALGFLGNDESAKLLIQEILLPRAGERLSMGQSLALTRSGFTSV